MQIRSYKVLKTIGKGAMGEVYLAKHPTLGKKVVIKQLKMAKTQKNIKQFENEAANIYGFQSENIVNCYDHFKRGEEYFIVLEYVSGLTLADLIGMGKIPIAHALLIFREIAKGIQYAHAKGVIHRDIKPGNVLLSYDGEIKLADFGISSTNEDLSGESKSRIIGTPCYMAPELFENAQNASPSSDIYALGVVLYFMLAGDRPFSNDLDEKNIRNIQKGRYKHIWGLPFWLSRLIASMMHYKLSSRMQDLNHCLKILNKKILIKDNDKVKKIISKHIELNSNAFGHIRSGEIERTIIAPDEKTIKAAIKSNQSKQKEDKIQTKKDGLFSQYEIDKTIIRVLPFKKYLIVSLIIFLVTSCVLLYLAASSARIKINANFSANSKILKNPVKLYYFNNAVDKEDVDEEYRRIESKDKPNLVPYYKNKVKKMFSFYGFTQVPFNLKARTKDRFYYSRNLFKPKGTYLFVISFNDEYFYLVTKAMKPILEIKYHRVKIPFVNRRIKLYIDEINYTPNNTIDCRYLKKNYLNQFILFNDKEKKITKSELRVFANEFDLSESRKFGQMPLLPDKTYFIDFLDNKKRFEKVWMVPIRGAYLNRSFTFEIHMEKNK